MSKFLLAAVIAFVYILFLFLEMRFVVKENKPLKHLFRDGLLVYLSVLVGDFLLNQWRLWAKMCSRRLRSLPTPPIFNAYLKSIILIYIWRWLIQTY